jgi:hypothetical protein
MASATLTRAWQRRGALVGMEGSPVHAVHDGRNAQPVGGQTAENSGLGAVGVDDVGLEVAKHAFEVQIGEPVANGVDCPAHLRDDFEGHPPCPGPLE